MLGTSLEWREPLYLWLALTPLLLLWIRTQSRRRDTSYADTNLRPWLVVGEEQGLLLRVLSRNMIYAIAWVLLSVALAGPRQAITMDGKVLPSGRTLLAMVDLSRSMEATDVLPNRRRRAALELFELLDHVRGDKVGILVFAGRAHLYVPPTSDHNALRFYLRSLDSQVLPTRGSNIAQALEFAAKILADKPSAAVILLTDGDFTPSAVSLTQSLHDLTATGARISVLGIGTLEGEAIPLPEGGWLKQDGKPVISHLDENGLQALAEQGGGRYQRVTDDDSDWLTLYDHGIAQIDAPGSTPHTAEQTQWREYYAWFLLPALVLFFLSVMPYRLAVRWRGGVLLWCFFFFAMQLPDRAFADENALAQIAEQAWNNGNFQEASARYAAIPGYTGRMGEGVSYYRLQDYPAAARQFSQAILIATNDSERADALYNLGNSLFRQGDYTGAVQIFADVLRYRREDTRAENNLALSKALQQAVSSRQQEAGVAERSGRGPKSVRLPDGVDVSEKSTLSIDGGEPSLALSSLPQLPEDAEVLIAHGLEFSLTNREKGKGVSERWQQDITQARLRMQTLQEKPETVWRRVFEIEEGFPAPLEQPRNIPGVSPW